MINIKTRAVAHFSPDARTFHNIYKLQKHVSLRHQSYLIVFMGNKNLRFWEIMPLKEINHGSQNVLGVLTWIDEY